MTNTPEAERLLAMVEANAAKLSAGQQAGRKPLFDADDVRSRLRMYDRTPFLTVLQQFIQQGPTDEAIQKMAEKWPEKWVAATVQLARIAGFTEKTESTLNVNVSIGNMSDSQLEDDLNRELAELGIIDADFEQVEHANASGLAPAQREALAIEVKNDEKH